MILFVKTRETKGRARSCPGEIVEMMRLNQRGKSSLQRMATRQEERKTRRSRRGNKGKNKKDEEEEGSDD